MKPYEANPPRTSWGKAPEGYVGGAGRGAIGFTTRSDIGPSAPAAPTSCILLLTRLVADYSDTKFDKDFGFQQSLFGEGILSREDEEADKLMASRRGHQRKKRERQEMEEYRKKNPTLGDLFRENRRELQKMSYEEWDTLPESKDFSRHNIFVNRREDRYTPLPDSILKSAVEEAKGQPADIMMAGKANTKILSVKLDKMADSVKGQTVVDPQGYVTDMNNMTGGLNLADVSRARLLLTNITRTNKHHAPGWIALARLEETAGKHRRSREVSLKGCEFCPKSEEMWLEAARLHRKKEAKAILAKAIGYLPNSVQLWLMAAELEKSIKRKKLVLRKALENIPDSTHLWKVAIELEPEEDARILLKKAVEENPKSVELWLALAHLEYYKKARVVLKKARKMNPTAITIWIAAAELEEEHVRGSDNPDEIKKGADLVDTIIKTTVTVPKTYDIVVTREQWLQHAQTCELQGYVLTCQSIVRHTIHMGLEEMDLKRIWSKDIAELLGKPQKDKMFDTARAITTALIERYPKDPDSWWKAIHLERDRGRKEDMHQLIRDAVSVNPHEEDIWLFGISEYLKENANERELVLKSEKPENKAAKLMEDAFKANPNSESLWLKHIEIASLYGNIDHALETASKALEKGCQTPRVYMKTALLYRQDHQFENERKTLLSFIDDEKKKMEKLADTQEEELPMGNEQVPVASVDPMVSAKIYLMLAQNYSREGDHKSALGIYERATRIYKTFLPLWISYTREIMISDERNINAYNSKLQQHKIAKARTILTKAKNFNPQNPELWLEAIRLEGGCDNKNLEKRKLSREMLSKALKDCPESGLLWAYSIDTERREKKRSKCKAALEHCQKDPHVCLSVAKVFWAARKVRIAKNWFERALSSDADLGDVWAYYLLFLREFFPASKDGREKRLEKMIERCEAQKPTHGILWVQESKRLGNENLTTKELLENVANKIIFKK